MSRSPFQRRPSKVKNKKMSLILIFNRNFDDIMKRFEPPTPEQLSPSPMTRRMSLDPVWETENRTEVQIDMSEGHPATSYIDVLLPSRTFEALKANISFNTRKELTTSPIVKSNRIERDAFSTQS